MNNKIIMLTKRLKDLGLNKEAREIENLVDSNINFDENPFLDFMEKEEEPCSVFAFCERDGADFRDLDLIYKRDVPKYKVKKGIEEIFSKAKSVFNIINADERESLITIDEASGLFASRHMKIYHGEENISVKIGKLRFSIMIKDYKRNDEGSVIDFLKKGIVSENPNDLEKNLLDILNIDPEFEF